MSYFEGPQPGGVWDPTWRGQWDEFLSDWWLIAMLVHMGGAIG